MPILSRFFERVLSQSGCRAVFEDILEKKFFVFVVLELKLFLTDASQQSDLHMILCFSLSLQTGNDCVDSVNETCKKLPRKQLGFVFNIRGFQGLLLLRCETMFAETWMLHFSFFAGGVCSC